MFDVKQHQILKCQEKYKRDCYLFNSNYRISHFVPGFVYCCKLMRENRAVEMLKHIFICSSGEALLTWATTQQWLLATSHRQINREMASGRNQNQDGTHAEILPTWPSPRKSSFSYRLALVFTSSAIAANSRFHYRTLAPLLKVPRATLSGLKEVLGWPTAPPMDRNHATLRAMLFWASFSVN